MKNERKRTFLLITIPILALFVCFNTIPLIRGVIYSFTNFKGFGSYDWVGFRNYADLFTDARVGKSYLFTFKLAIVTTVVVNVISLILALALNGRIRAKSFFRGAYFLPNILGALVVGYIFNYFFTYILPAMGAMIGSDGLSKSILSNPDSAWIGIVIVCAWQAIAMNTIIYISGLQTVPEDVYEAGGLDGATGWKQFRYLTFPLIIPFFSINMVLCVKNFLMVFDQICAVLDQGNIEYVKWDMNRSLTDIYSMEHAQGKVTYDYVCGVYEFLERLMERYPNMLIEGCSGGGGRFDAGMLYYTPQIWCSDNTDAVDRLRIQYGTSFFYPACVVGSHVSAVPNHQTGRTTSLHTRGVVAMAGTFGYELNPELLSKEEKDEIQEQIARYKKYEELVCRGDYYRLSNPFADVCAAWAFVSEDREQVLLSVVMQEIHGNMTVNYVRLKGLDPNAVYRDAQTGACYYGSALMAAGIPMPVEMGAYWAYQIYMEIVG